MVRVIQPSNAKTFRLSHVLVVFNRCPQWQAMTFQAVNAFGAIRARYHGLVAHYTIGCTS
jgi:hypothetical protein